MSTFASFSWLLWYPQHFASIPGHSSTSANPYHFFCLSLVRHFCRILLTGLGYLYSNFCCYPSACSQNYSGDFATSRHPPTLSNSCLIIRGSQVSYHQISTDCLRQERPLIGTSCPFLEASHSSMYSNHPFLSFSFFELSI